MFGISKYIGLKKSANTIIAIILAILLACCYSVKTNDTTSQAIQYIKTNEGLRLMPYRCKANKLTIGYGRNLDSVGISVEEAKIMLANDIDKAVNALYNIFGVQPFCSLSNNRQVVLIDMMFNLGYKRFGGFVNMIQAIKDEDWNKAADEILDSKYARIDVPNRAKQNAKLMKDQKQERKKV